MLAMTWHDGARAAEPVRVARDNVSIAGRGVRCGNVRTRFDQDLPNLGIAVPEAGLLILNPMLMRRFNDAVQLFVFHHECGHHHVGGSEMGADCWAVERGIRDGWLTASNLGAVCQSFGSAPETPTHPSGRQRCANLDRCFAAVTAAVDRELARTKPVAAAPKLVRGPDLLWSGRVASAAALAGSRPRQ
jgi:hypothetical protein